MNKDVGAEKKKAPEREQIEIEKTPSRQFTLRIPDEVFEKTKIKADEIGSSHNSFINILIDLGLKLYDGKVVIRREIQ